MNNAGFFSNIHPKLNMCECTFLLQNQFGYIKGLPGVLTSEVVWIQLDHEECEVIGLGFWAEYKLQPIMFGTTTNFALMPKRITSFNGLYYFC